MRNNFKKKILSDKVEIMLPPGFKQMEEATVVIKYPNEGSRPDVVFTNNSNTVNFAFTHTAKRTTATDIIQHADGLINILQQHNNEVYI